MKNACARGWSISLWIVMVAGSAWAQSASPAASPVSQLDLDTYVATAMKTFDVPGIAVAIVKDGKVVLAKGYGVKKRGEPAPVDENTMFAIGSNSKAFTTAGRLSSANPVRPTKVGSRSRWLVSAKQVALALPSG